MTSDVGENTGNQFLQLNKSSEIYTVTNFAASVALITKMKFPLFLVISEATTSRVVQLKKSLHLLNA